MRYAIPKLLLVLVLTLAVSCKGTGPKGQDGTAVSGAMVVVKVGT